MPEVTDEEKKNYRDFFVATSNALGDALRILHGLEAAETDPDERRKIVLRRRNVEDQITQVDRDFRAFARADFRLRPPSDRQVDAVMKSATELAALTQEATELRAVMKLTKFIMTKYQSLG